MKTTTYFCRLQKQQNIFLCIFAVFFFVFVLLFAFLLVRLFVN